MPSAKKLKVENPRLAEVTSDLVDTLRAFIRKHRINHEEYRRAIGFMLETAQAGEIPLLADVLLEVTVDEVDGAGRAGTTTCIEGPYYVPGAPVMKSPCVLPHRADEPGDVLVFSGVVRGTDGAVLAGAVVDLWQSDAAGAYSHFNIPESAAPFNLRARVIADRNGAFQAETRVPASYEIPKAGPTGALLAAMGRHPWRPAHLHMKVTHEGYSPLTTQLFVKDDPWIDSDVVGAVKPPLVVGLTRNDDPADLRKNNRTRPFYTLAYDFVLPRATAKAA